MYFFSPAKTYPFTFLVVVFGTMRSILLVVAVLLQHSLAQDECICYEQLADGLSNPLLLLTSPDDTGRWCMFL